MIVVLKVKQSIIASADASIQRLISSQHEKQQIQWQEYTVLLPLFSRKARGCSKRNHMKNCKGKAAWKNQEVEEPGLYQTHRETIGVTRQGLVQPGFVQVLQLRTLDCWEEDWRKGGEE